MYNIKDYLSSDDIILFNNNMKNIHSVSSMNLIDEYNKISYNKDRTLLFLQPHNFYMDYLIIININDINDIKLYVYSSNGLGLTEYYNLKLKQYVEYYGNNNIHSYKVIYNNNNFKQIFNYDNYNNIKIHKHRLDYMDYYKHYNILLNKYVYIHIKNCFYNYEFLYFYNKKDYNIFCYKDISYNLISDELQKQIIYIFNNYKNNYII